MIYKSAFVVIFMVLAIGFDYYMTELPIVPIFEDGEISDTHASAIEVILHKFSYIFSVCVGVIIAVFYLIINVKGCCDTKFKKILLITSGSLAGLCISFVGTCLNIISRSLIIDQMFFKNEKLDIIIYLVYSMMFTSVALLFIVALEARSND